MIYPLFPQDTGMIRTLNLFVFLKRTVLALFPTQFYYSCKLLSRESHLKPLQEEHQAYERGRMSEALVIKVIFSQLFWSSSQLSGIKKEI